MAARTGLASLWRSPRIRSIAIQAALAAVLVAALAFVADNTIANLRRLNVNTGFRFLWQPAGFAINQTLIPYSEASSYFTAFVVALLNTLVLSAAGIVAATVIGFVIGIARLSRNWLIAKLAAVYVETLRNIPLLLQIFFWYFAILRPLPGPRQSVSLLWGTVLLNNRGLYLPEPVVESGFGVLVALLIAAAVAIALNRWARQRQAASGQRPRLLAPVLLVLVGLPAATALLTGFSLHWDRPQLVGFNLQGGIAVIPEFVAMLLALSLYIAAFIAEIVRAGILAVPAGQVEAARALGLRRAQIYRLVIVPQALRVILPPLTNQYVNLVKASSLAAAIAYPDLMLIFAGTVLNQTGQALEVMTITMLVYLTISLTVSLLMNLYNRRVALVER
ncbi:MAG TPA: amino acid ABC transporter permease [Alphaproteobacteria bacterium]|nr:amino acid ABC transporter permease [Alphaproteobacteria bacterium]